MMKRPVLSANDEPDRADPTDPMCDSLTERPGAHTKADGGFPGPLSFPPSLPAEG